MNPQHRSPSAIRGGAVTALLNLFGASALCCSQISSASELAVHGFGTLGATYIDKPAGWAYARTMNQRSTTDAFRADVDSVAGVQVNFSATSRLELVGQAAVSALDSDARVSDYLELAFVGYRPDANWNLRLGRVNLDAFLLSDHRDVGFTYGFIRPPVEFYARMPTFLDGGDVSRYWLVGDVQWQAKVFAGTTAGGTGSSRLELWPLYGVMVERESEGLTLRASGVIGRNDNDLHSLDPLVEGLRRLQGIPVPRVAGQAGELATTLAAKNARTTYVSAGAAYDRNNWLATAEVSRASVKHKPEMGFTSAYLSIGRRFGSVSAFVMESASLRDGHEYVAPDWATPLAPIDPVLGQQAQQLANGAALAINRTGPRQFTTSLGMRWDVSPRVAFKGQWDHVNPLRNGSGLWKQSDGRPLNADIFGVAVNYVF